MLRSPTYTSADASDYSFTIEIKDDTALTSDISVESLEKEARWLVDKAYSQLKDTDSEFERARRAQLEAEKAVELANQLTADALKMEIECKKYMVQAGQKLMLAGARLQAEASRIGQDRETTLNILHKGQLRQDVRVDVPSIQPSEIHVHQRQIGHECTWADKNNHFHKQFRSTFL
uniref:Uncharacterized protein n=1 Tax=Acrobeloides nanus TaxID=290746 RepID=A0A914EL77_9BILA